MQVKRASKGRVHTRPDITYHPTSQTRAPRQIITRLFDVLPGGLAWAGIAGVIAGAYVTPLVVLWGAVVLAAYSTLRFVLAALGALWGLRQVGRWESQDWDAVYHQRATASSLSLGEVHHLVIIPNYNEDSAILRRTLNRLASVPGARQSMSVVLAMEAREPGAREKGMRLQAKYGDQFKHCLVTIHPAGLSGEVACKAANLSWAARRAKHVLVDRLGYRLDAIVVTVADADTLWHPSYFASLGTLFATDDRRHRTFWQAPIRYHGNVWVSGPLMRILHAYAAAWELAYLAAPWWRALPMSSYSFSLRLLHATGYWDPDTIADEWHLYIKAHFRSGGVIRLQPVFLPFAVNAVTGSTPWRTWRERYLQTLRHAWGAKTIGYTASQMARNPSGERLNGLGLLARVTHDNLLAGLGWIIMIAGAQLPVLVHSALWQDSRSFLPIVALRVCAVLIAVLTLAFWVIDVRIRPPRPHHQTVRHYLAEMASLPLLAVLTFGCMALPVLHAQTLMMLGATLRFRVAAKT
jgi:hypothetical protein